MSLISSPLAVAPRVRLAPPAARNDAELVVELAAAYGTEFDPWQIDVLEVGCGVREDGLWAAQTVGCNVPAAERQVGGPDRPGAGGALLFGEKVIILSAHEQKTSPGVVSGPCCATSRTSTT